MNVKKRILVLGSGMVSRPGVKYLLKQSDLSITVASNELDSAQRLINGYKNGQALFLDVNDEKKLGDLIKEHDIIISLLPWIFHVRVAKMCLEYNKDMATSSYASPEMRNLDSEARAKDLLLLNEMGVDPGIDHMAAMNIIDMVKKEGGKVLHFYSICGGLPAPEDNNNPFGYKFSWSPKGVLLASKNSARFLEKGKEINIDGRDLFLNYRLEDVPGIGQLEVYPNRDSLPYKELYHLNDAQTVMRGTYRYPGWCDTLKKIADFGLLDEKPRSNLKEITYKQMMAQLAHAGDNEDVIDKTAEKLEIPKDSPIIKKLMWLGLFENKKTPPYNNYLDKLSHLMQEKLTYREGEKDMLVQQHRFVVENKDRTMDLITATMVDFGIPGGDSSMARTVSLPLAIGVKLMADGKINLTGVRIPNSKEIYNPVLKELESMDIKFDEIRIPVNSGTLG